MKKTTKFPCGWDETRVQCLLQQYECQMEAEDEAVYKGVARPVMKASAKAKKVGAAANLGGLGRI
jgi:hypothetical protein